jgi:hypothetical protein
MKTSICCLTAVCACLPLSAAADEAVADAYAEIFWNTLAISLDPDDSGEPPGDGYLEWDDESLYSGAGVDMAWWTNDLTDGDNFADAVGADADDPDFSESGNGWGAGTVGDDRGAIAGQASASDSLSSQAHIVLTTPDSHAESMSSAVQGGLLTTSEAGVLSICFNYYVWASAYATGDADAFAQADAQFFLYNDSVPNSPLTLDIFDVIASAIGGGSDLPNPVTGTWEGFVHLGSGDQAAFGAQTYTLALGDTPGETIPAEPGTVALMGAGLALLGGRAWRWRTRARESG